MAMSSSRRRACFIAVKKTSLGVKGTFSVTRTYNLCENVAYVVLTVTLLAELFLGRDAFKT